MASVSLAIIAGGKARRLSGAPKGLIRVGGRTIIDRLLDVASDSSDAMLVGSKLRDAKLRSVEDVIAGRGAPGGVHAALVHASSPWVLAIAWDMPFVSRPVVERLLAERADSVDAVCFRVAGRLEPLLGLYRTAAEPTWRAALVDAPSFTDIYRRLRATVLPEEALRAVDADARAVVSLNAPEDLLRWSAVLPGSQPLP
jgi:molybdenum cofactor guanylyltransferase